jgi:predicted kinase
VRPSAHPQFPALVLVTGPPAAGKTGIARGLADALALPLLEKDALKETIGGALGISDRATSQRLGGAVFDVIAAVAHDLLRRGVSVLAEGNFTAGSRLVASLPPCRVVQVHVSAAPHVLRERLLARDTHRHPVHYDAAAADEIAERAGHGAWAALPLHGPTLAIDTTTGFPEMHRIVAKVESALSQ